MYIHTYTYTHVHSVLFIMLFPLCRQRSPPHEGIVFLIPPADSSLMEAQKDAVAKRGNISVTNPFTSPDDSENLRSPNDMEMMALSSSKTWVDDYL